MLTFLISAAIFFLLYLLVVFYFTFKRREWRITRIGWGVGVILLTLFSFGFFHNFDARTILLTLLFVIYGSWMAIAQHLDKNTEGFPFDEWKEKVGRYHLVAVFVYFYLYRGAVIFALFWPIYVINCFGGRGFYISNGLGVVLILVAFVYQLQAWREERFLKEVGNWPGFGQTGLRRFSRHPELFSEALLFWGTFFVVVGTIYWPTVLLSTILATVLILLRIQKIEEKYARDPAYVSYSEKVNAMFPWKRKVNLIEEFEVFLEKHIEEGKSVAPEEEKQRDITDNQPETTETKEEAFITEKKESKAVKNTAVKISSRQKKNSKK